MAMLGTALLLTVVLIATVTDLRSHKIYNWTTYPGIIAALALNAVGSGLEWRVDPARLGTLQRMLGWIGLGQSLAGFVACGFLMLVCFVFFRVGGGDVKLMAMLGGFLGVSAGLEVLLWTFVIGACVGLSMLVWGVGAISMATGIARHAWQMLRLRGWAPVSDTQSARLQSPLFLAPSAAAAVVLVHFNLLDYVNQAAWLH